MRGSESRRPALVSRVRAFACGLSRHANRAGALRALLDAVSSTRVPDRMAANIVDLAFEWFGGETWAVLAADEADTMRALAERGALRGQRAELVEWAGKAVAHAAVTVASAGDDGAGRAHGSMVAIPLKSHGRVVAVLIGHDSAGAERGADAAFDGPRAAALQELLEAMGGPLDMALRLKRANALSSIDDLTGLYNSRFLDDSMRREVKRSVRTGRPLSLLFVDLDGFKGINDRYGHLCGSRALVEAAGRIQAGARETDIVARFGGDEFALVLPDTGREGAMMVARRVRERVSSLPFLADEGIGYRLTASVGAATLCEKGTPESLLAAADTAMYRVKGRGKDGIEMADVVAPSQQS